MKNDCLRRFGALMLALALALPLAVTPAWAASTPFSVKLKGNKTTVEPGETVNFTAIDVNAPTGVEITYTWKSNIRGGDLSELKKETVDAGKPSTQQISILEDKKDGDVITVRVEAKYTDNSGAEFSAADEWRLTVSVPSAANVPVTGVSIEPASLTLCEGEEKTLNALVDPANASNKAVTWSIDRTDVATVTPSGTAREATVKGLKEGTAVITVVTADGNKIKTCQVTVTKKFVEANSLSFTKKTDQKNKNDGNSWEYTPKLMPEDATIDKVEWKSSDPSVATVTASTAANAAPVTGVVTRGNQPGKTTITVVVTSGARTLSDDFELVVSGITLNRTSLSLAMGKSETLAVKQPFFGEAAGQAVTWSSDRADIAMVSGGVVTARNQAGTAKITATTKDGLYSAECVVTVSEDTSGLIQAGNVSAGSPMNMSTAAASTVFNVGDPDQPYYSGTIANVLNSLAQYKYKSPLSYVTNLSVSTAQGVLYYGYVSEADPGAGVGSTEQYYVSGAQGLLALNQVSFVPRASFTGSVDISYTAWTVGGQAFSGIIRVPVNGAAPTSGITYTANEGQPARFQAADFEEVCWARTGRGLDYVTFNLPSSAYGTLYYKYVGGYGERVDSGTRYRSSGVNHLDNVSFVPAQGYSGTITVSYRAYPQGGSAFVGQVTIKVTSQAGQGLVNYTGSKRAPVYFQANDFNMACYNATNEMLSYVRFQLPPSSEGTLYYNYYSGGGYNTPVSAGTNYYRSGMPSVGGVCFVPASTAPDTVSIPFTGIGAGGASFAGTVFIRLDSYGGGVAQSIQYSAYQGRPAVFQVNDFNNASVAATGAALNYVQFQLPSSNQGTLYYNYSSNSSYGNRVYAGTSYYRTGSGYQNLIGNISFVPSSNYVGTSYFNYTGYAINGQSFTGTVAVQVSNPTPSDVNYTVSSSSPIRLSSATLRNVCNPVLSRELSYIEITSLPSSTLGQLYANYSGFGSGTLANVGGRYYCSSNPSIDQLYFVPRGGAQGTATVTYTGYSSSGERVSGRINFTLTSSGTSRYFTDMGKHAWAAAAVDYLYANDVTNGVAPGQYGPNQKMLRRDFVLMLCRAFDFTGGSGYSFADVPTNAYYANAVATAKRMGIVNGDGVNFRPNSSVTRQDAMVMIKNALTASGWSLGSGTSVDLSRFVDSREVSSYARDAVGTLVRIGAVNGDNRGRLNPRGDITRAEIAVILHFVMTM